MLQIVDVRKIVGKSGDFPKQMAGSGGTGQPLVKLEHFAADLIRFQPGKCIEEHTHPGDHILYCLGGTGTLVFAGERHLLSEGTIYMVPGTTPHAILTTEQDDELTLMSIANQHFPVDSAKRSDFATS